MSNKESATLVEQELCTFPDDDRDYCNIDFSLYIFEKKDRSEKGEKGERSETKRV